jgi:hypothetical protein
MCDLCAILECVCHQNLIYFRILLLRLVAENILCGAHGSEHDYPFIPFVLPWRAEAALTPAAVLDLMGAHPVLQQHIVELDVADGPLCAPFGALADTVFAVLAAYAPPICFYAGSDQLNPLPIVWVGRVSETEVGGFLSVLVHT